MAHGPAEGAVLTLFEYGYNIDSDIFDIINGDPLPSGVDASAFDADTGLGTISVTVRDAGPRYVGLLLDHEIDLATNGNLNEFGATVGTPAVGQSWEIDEPEEVFGDIISNFVASNLDNTNGVPEGSEDDVAMALAWNFTSAAGEIARILYRVSETPPTSGFYLSQTDPDSNDGEGATIYFSSSFSAAPVPEPTTAAIWMLLGCIGLGVYRLRPLR
jgi:hypothetical protein